MAKPQTHAQSVVSEDTYEAAQASEGIVEDGADIMRMMTKFDDMLSDDLRTKALLDPIIATGEALLRDLAYRVRAFRPAFAAWESLHLIPSHGSHRREDFIQRLLSLKLPAADRIAAIHTYDRFRNFINSLGSRLFPWIRRAFGDPMSLHSSLYNGGRGIVFTAGDHQAKYLLSSIPSFRKLGCKLPIEVLYLGDDDLSEDYRDRLEALDSVVTRDLTQMIDDEGWALAGWAAKPFAILMSSFREAIFIDADALFFDDPATLFDDVQYQTTGALFFKDRSLMPESKKKWLREILPSPISQGVRQSRLWTGESGHMQESGVVVVDKWRHFVPLLLAMRLNGPDRDGDVMAGKKGMYDMVYGDKETFWLSWELAGDADYAFHDGATGTMGTPEMQPDPADRPTGEPTDYKVDAKPAKDFICSAQLLHLDREGRPLWFNGWIERHKHELSEFETVPFDVFARESKVVMAKGEYVSPWDIRNDNIVCLEAAELLEFSDGEREVLEMLQDLAKAETGVP